MFGTPLGGPPDPVRSGAARDEDDDDYDDEDDERPRHPYTWLHLIVLALVAFVLGFLIVLLLSNTTEDDPGSTAAAPVTHSTTGLSAGPA